jgi:hypothetical protein
LLIPVKPLNPALFEILPQIGTTESGILGIGIQIPPQNSCLVDQDINGAEHQAQIRRQGRSAQKFGIILFQVLPQ